MEIDLKVLDKITATAIRAEGFRDYNIGPKKRLHIRPDGTRVEVDLDDFEEVNEILTIADAVRIFRRFNDTATLWVGEQCIHVEHDNVTRLAGRSALTMEKSPAMRYIEKSEKEVTSYKPESFEKIAKLYFGADAVFIARLRKLQWQEKTESNAQISNVSKSMSMDAIAKVLDANGSAFEDVVLTVKCPVYVVPFKTAEVAIDLNIVANAETKTISFAPLPGVVAEHTRAAIAEIHAAVCESMEEAEHPFVYMGQPTHLPSY